MTTLDLFGNPLPDEPRFSATPVPPPPAPETQTYYWALRGREWTPAEIIKEGLTTTIWK